jgi:hypothetical protein
MQFGRSFEVAGDSMVVAKGGTFQSLRPRQTDHTAASGVVPSQRLMAHRRLRLHPSDRGNDIQATMAHRINCRGATVAQ